MKALGWPLNELIGKPFRDVLDERRCAELLDVISNAEPKEGIRASFQRKDGNLFSTECSVFYLQEQPAGMCSVITFSVPESLPERKAISFRHLFESNMFGIVYGDIYNRVFEANEAFLDMAGYTQEDFISGKIGWTELTPEEYAPLDQAAIQEIKTHGAFHPYEKQLIRKDGSRVDLLTGGLLEEGTSDRVVAFVVDVSARKRAERASLAGEDLFRRMADSSNALIWFLGPDLK